MISFIIYVTCLNIGNVNKINIFLVGGPELDPKMPRDLFLIFLLKSFSFNFMNLQLSANCRFFQSGSICCPD